MNRRERDRLMSELRAIVWGCRVSRPGMLEAFDETVRLAQLGESMAVGLGRPRRRQVPRDLFGRQDAGSDLFSPQP